EEGHRHHRCFSRTGRLQVIDGTGREGERGQRPEPRRLDIHRGALSDGFAIRLKLLQQADCLEEVKREGFGEKPGGDRVRWNRRSTRRRRTRRSRADGLHRAGIAHSSLCSPARGGHFLKYLSPCEVRAINWLNELIETYSPRNRSSMLANR